MAYVRIHTALEKAPLTLAQVADAGKQIYAKCDKLDGLEDGLIDDPRKCDFDPIRDLTGFTDAQKQTLASIYSPVVSNGEAIFPGLPWAPRPAPARRPTRLGELDRPRAGSDDPGSLHGDLFPLSGLSP